jgi:hypothetical protein
MKLSMPRRLGALAAAVVTGSALAVAAPIAQSARAAGFTCPAHDHTHGYDPSYGTSAPLTRQANGLWGDGSVYCFYNGAMLYLADMHSVVPEHDGAPAVIYYVRGDYPNAAWFVRYQTLMFTTIEYTFTDGNILDWDTLA